MERRNLVSTICLEVYIFIRFCFLLDDDSHQGVNYVKEKSNRLNNQYDEENGLGHYTSIKSMTDNASDANTMFVYNGTYTENMDNLYLN